PSAARNSPSARSASPASPPGSPKPPSPAKTSASNAAPSSAASSNNPPRHRQPVVRAASPRPGALPSPPVQPKLMPPMPNRHPLLLLAGLAATLALTGCQTYTSQTANRD